MKGEAQVEHDGPLWKITLATGVSRWFSDECTITELVEHHRDAQTRADALLALIVHRQREAFEWPASLELSPGAEHFPAVAHDVLTQVTGNGPAHAARVLA